MMYWSWQTSFSVKSKLLNFNPGFRGRSRTSQEPMAQRRVKAKLQSLQNCQGGTLETTYIHPKTLDLSHFFSHWYQEPVQFPYITKGNVFRAMVLPPSYPIYQFSDQDRSEADLVTQNLQEMIFYLCSIMRCLLQMTFLWCWYEN